MKFTPLMTNDPPAPVIVFVLSTPATIVAFVASVPLVIPLLAVRTTPAGMNVVWLPLVWPNWMDKTVKLVSTTLLMFETPADALSKNLTFDPEEGAPEGNQFAAVDQLVFGATPLVPFQILWPIANLAVATRLHTTTQPSRCRPVLMFGVTLNPKTQNDREIRIRGYPP